VRAQIELIVGTATRRLWARRRLPASMNSFDQPKYCDAAIPFRRQNSEIMPYVTLETPFMFARESCCQHAPVIEISELPTSACEPSAGVLPPSHVNLKFVA
jgi:hypothetical protein